jgi:proliferating cell nuclear antigen
MFNIKKENNKILKGIIEALGGIVDETAFKITPEGLVALAMDKSRICLLKLEISKEHFDEYKCDKETKICVNLSDLDKILKRSSTNDSIELSYLDKEQKLKISMKRGESSRKRTFSLALINADIEEIPMDGLLKIDYASKWTIKPEIIIEAIKDAEIYSEILNAKSEEKQGLSLRSSGQIGEMTYEIELSDLFESSITGTNTGSYSLSFLKAIMKLAPITEKLEVSLKTDHPLKLKFDLLEGGELYYFLAPRVDEDLNAEEIEEILESENLSKQIETKPEIEEEVEE